MRNKLDRIRMIREAGYVTRCHTLPHHGEYSVGKHSYDALCILFILCEDPSINLIKAVLLHDSGERWLGDLPAPAKMNSKELRTWYEELEQRILYRLDIPIAFLSNEERKWLRAVDILEFYLWCLDQHNMGNRNVKHPIDVCLRALNSPETPEQVSQLLHTIDIAKFVRGPDTLDGILKQG